MPIKKHYEHLVDYPTAEDFRRMDEEMRRAEREYNKPDPPMKRRPVDPEELDSFARWTWEVGLRPD